MTTYIGTATSRVDGRAKVTGEAKYAGEFKRRGLAYASVVASTIAEGPHQRASTPARRCGSPACSTCSPTRTGRAWPTPTRPTRTMWRRRKARRSVRSTTTRSCSAASRSRWCWPKTGRPRASPPRWCESSMTSRASRHRPARAASIRPLSVEKPEKPRGDADKAFAAAAVRHEAEYFIPIEHHNPMELFASTVMWDGDGKLTVYDKTQGVQNVQRYLCSVFDMKPDDVRVMSPFVGGAFGSGLRPQYQVVLAVLGALALQRSVRLVLTRQQMYGLGYRPATIERLELGAKADGTLDAITHEAIAVTSQYEEFSRNDTGWSALLYKCANAKYAHKLAGSTFPPPATCARRARRPASMRSNARWTSSPSRSSSIRWSCGCAATRTRPERGSPLHQQEAARMLPPGRGSVRLEQAQPRAALDARRQRTGRLGHGDRRLGSAADADRGPHRADRQRPCGSLLRDLRHRHRHLHDHGAGRGRHARPADREHHHQARRLHPAAVAGRRRIVDGGLGGACDRGDGRGGPRGTAGAGEEDAGFTAGGREA